MHLSYLQIKKKLNQEYPMEIFFLRQSSTSFGFDKPSILAATQTEGITSP